MDDTSSQIFKECLQGQLEDLVAKLGYDPQKPDVRKKSQIMLEAAILFARLIAKQRAIFKLRCRKVEPEDLQKLEDDELMTCIDDNEAEVAGSVWFVSTPALLKWGTGTGQDLGEYTCLVKSNVVLVRGGQSEFYDDAR